MEIGRYMHICKFLVIFLMFFNSLSYAEEILHPTIQVSNLSDVVYKINTKELLPYLTRAGIIQNKNLNNLPHITSFSTGGLVVSGADIIYVKGINSLENTIFNVVRFGSILTDPVSKAYLGSSVDVIATAKIIEVNERSQLRVMAAYRDIQVGDVIIPSMPLDLPGMLDASYPKNAMQGQILQGLNSRYSLGKHDTVIVNLGSKNKLVVGDLLNIRVANLAVIDSNQKQKKLENLPGSKIGEILVYQVYDQVSFGVILHANTVVQSLDMVTN